MSNKRISLIVAMLALPASAAAQTVDSASAAAVAEGKSIYQGKVGGALCFTCHGPVGKGIAGLGPDLSDGTWLHGDGSLAFVQEIVRTGVVKPKQAAVMMPPMGGGKLTVAQLAAVAAYVRSLK